MVRSKIVNRKDVAVETIDKGDRTKMDWSFRLWLMIALTRDLIYSIRKKELRKYGISPQQAGTLLWIRQSNNNATAAALSRWQFRKPNTMTTILRRMIKKGLIRKSTDKYKKNVQRLSLTKKGEEVLLHAVKRSSIKKVMSELSEEQHEQFYNLLHILLETGSKQLKKKVDMVDYIRYLE